MDSWRTVWRALAAELSVPGLEALRKALETDSPLLIQRATTLPPPLAVAQSWPCEAACLIGFCGWKGDGLETVAEVERFFADRCYKTDCAIGEPAACRWLLNWFDDTPRDEMLRLLLPEVERELARRTEVPA